MEKSALNNKPRYFFFPLMNSLHMVGKRFCFGTGHSIWLLEEKSKSSVLALWEGAWCYVCLFGRWTSTSTFWIDTDDIVFQTSVQWPSRCLFFFPSMRLSTNQSIMLLSSKSVFVQIQKVPGFLDASQQLKITILKM